MMSHTNELARFIGMLPDRRKQDERLELVIAGDFVDFLAIPPFLGSLKIHPLRETNSAKL
jgi:hypothetical protein